MKVFTALLMVFVLLGCKPADDLPTAKTTTSILPLPTRSPTPEQWKAALDSTYVITDSKELGDGVTEFNACFEQKEKCSSFAFGKRDAFQKARVFTPGLFSHIDAGTYLKTSIVLIDNKLPAIVLQPYFFGKNGWLFMEKFAVMADGAIILERSFENHEVNRKNDTTGVEERASSVITNDELAALRSMATAKEIMIRFTGSNGYASLKPGQVETVKVEIANALFIYDKLTTALSGNIPFV